MLGTHFLKTGNLIRFSQQALVDCSWGLGNNGCDGGEDFRVYEFMMKHGGIPTEDSYGPYLGAQMNEILILLWYEFYFKNF